MNSMRTENHQRTRYKKYIAYLIIISGLFVFYLCADGFIEELTSGYKDFLLNWLGKTNKWDNSYGPYLLAGNMNEITVFADDIFIALFSLIFGGYLIVRKKFRTLFTYIIVVLGAALFHVFLKNYFGGTTWNNWLNPMAIHGKTFPSGHALVAVVFYFTMARLIYRANPSGSLNKYLFTVALFINILIGTSLLITGMHSPNEIIAGWAMGSVWINAAWLVDHFIRRTVYLRKHSHNSEEA
jgi:undecaprenyl-diphosphatase